MVKYRLLEDAKTLWWNSVNHDMVYMLQDEEFEQILFLKMVLYKEEGQYKPQ